MENDQLEIKIARSQGKELPLIFFYFICFMTVDIGCEAGWYTKNASHAVDLFLLFIFVGMRFSGRTWTVVVGSKSLRCDFSVLGVSIRSGEYKISPDSWIRSRRTSGSIFLEICKESGSRVLRLQTVYRGKFILDKLLNEQMDDLRGRVAAAISIENKGWSK
jgi:hypothetical protein